MPFFRRLAVVPSGAPAITTFPFLLPALAISMPAQPTSVPASFLPTTSTASFSLSTVVLTTAFP